MFDYLQLIDYLQYIPVHMLNSDVSNCLITYNIYLYTC